MLKSFFERQTRNRLRSRQEPVRRYVRLEERILLDATLDFPLPVDDASDALPTVQWDHESPMGNVPKGARHELIFVDSAVSDVAGLLRHVGHDSNNVYEVRFLAADTDGIQQITAALESRQDVAAIHILGHGAAGQLRLGNALVTAERLSAEYATSLTNWGASLDSQGDVLIYGCNVGLGERGEDFAATLSQLTGADVALSTNLTGSSELGDWNLEREIGEINTEVPFEQEALHSYIHTLAILDVSAAVSADGTPSFDSNDNPGNDSGPNNGIVRSHDTVQFDLFYNTDIGGATNPTFRSTLPVGLEWSFVPAIAASGASSGIFDSVTGALGGDRRTLVMQIPDIAGTISSSITVSARALAVQNGTSVQNITFTAESNQNGTTLGTSEDIDLVITSASHVDIELLSPTLRGEYTDELGTSDGVVYTYGIGLLTSHPTRFGIDALKGSAPLESTLQFDIDLSAVSPNARLFDWGAAIGEYLSGDGITRNYEQGVNNRGVPITLWSRGTSPAGLTGEVAGNITWSPEWSTPNSGDWSASQSGNTVSVTVQAADTSGIHFPENYGNGGVIPQDEIWLAAGQVSIWIPVDEILMGNDRINGTRDDGTLVVAPRITSFDPFDTWYVTNNFGLENPLVVPDTNPAYLEDLANNSYTHTVQAMRLGGGAKRNFERGVWSWVETSSTWNSGDGITTRGHQYDATVESGFNQGILDISGVIFGDKFDNTASRIVPISELGGVNRSNSAWSRVRMVGGGPSLWLREGTDYIVEFGTGGVGGAAAGWADWNSMGDATLANSESPVWSQDPTNSALGGTADPETGVRDSISKWRITMLRDVPPGYRVFAAVTMETIGPSMLDLANNPGGAIIANHYATTASYLRGIWRTSDYNPADNTWFPEGVSQDVSHGDRLTYVDAAVRLSQQIVDSGSGNLFLAGSRATVELDATVTIPTPITNSIARNVYVTDILPAGLVVVPGSMNVLAGDTYLQNPLDPFSPRLTVQTVEYWDGNAWLTSPAGEILGIRWGFGDVPVNTALPSLKFDVLIPVDAIDGQQWQNSAVISSLSDPSPEAWRTAQASLVAVQTAAVTVHQQVLTPQVPEDTTIAFSLQLQNLSDDLDITVLDAVDVLPYMGDPNGSQIHGEYSQIAVSQSIADLQVYVTTYDPSDLDVQDGRADGYADPGIATDAWYVPAGTGIWSFTLDDVHQGTLGAPSFEQVTALRFVAVSTNAPLLPPGESVAWTLELTPTGNSGDPSDTYVNSFMARVDASILPLPVFAPPATAQVVASKIGLAKQVINVTQQGTQYTLTVNLTVGNAGATELAEFSLFDDVVLNYAPHQAAIVAAPTIVQANATASPNVNPVYAADTSQNLLDGVSGRLAPGESFTIQLVITVDVELSNLTGGQLSLDNQASVTGRQLDANGQLSRDINGNLLPVITDLSDDGTSFEGTNLGAVVNGPLFTSTGSPSTSGLDDPTQTSITVYAYDSFSVLRNLVGTKPWTPIATSPQWNFPFAEPATLDPNTHGRLYHASFEIKKPQVSIDRMHSENLRPLGTIGDRSCLSLHFEDLFEDRGFNDDDLFIDARNEVDDVLTLYLTPGDRTDVPEHDRPVTNSRPCS